MSSGASWLSSCKEAMTWVGPRILINTNHQELLPISQLQRQRATIVHCQNDELSHVWKAFELLTSQCAH